MVRLLPWRILPVVYCLKCSLEDLAHGVMIKLLVEDLSYGLMVRLLPWRILPMV
jgi:hypothetical protein